MDDKPLQTEAYKALLSLLEQNNRAKNRLITELCDALENADWGGHDYDDRWKNSALIQRAREAVK